MTLACFVRATVPGLATDAPDGAIRVNVGDNHNLPSAGRVPGAEQTFSPLLSMTLYERPDVIPVPPMIQLGDTEANLSLLAVSASIVRVWLDATFSLIHSSTHSLSRSQTRKFTHSFWGLR